MTHADQSSEQTPQQTPAPWATGGADNQAPVVPWWQDAKIIAPMTLLLVILAVVVFWLPSQVSVTTDGAPETAAEPSKTLAPAAQTPLDESPWSQAQLAKQRREAQDILAAVLDKQRELEDSGVRLWAASAYEQALATAANGDLLYRNREFEAAKAEYLSTSDKFQALLDDRQNQFEQALDRGVAALNAHDASAAQESLTLALAIQPEDEQAVQAMERAQVLNQVLALVKQSQQLQELGQLDQAQSVLNNAEALDSQSGLVQEQKTLLSALVTERDFAEQMSKGYSALSNNQFSSAVAAFGRALKVKPGAADAQSALTQARNSLEQATIQTHLNAAVAAEKNEAWSEAVSSYDLALAEDSNLVASRVGRIKAQTRLELDESLETFLQEPLRLSDSAVYSNALATLNNARGIQNPGPRLASQIGQLSEQLRMAQTPVAVTLRSDNATFVTLYRVGQLGSFDQHSLQLKPGQYVLVGSRAGYRDVRKEFIVDATLEANVVEIMCDEKIASG